MELAYASGSNGVLHAEVKMPVSTFNKQKFLKEALR